MCRQYLLNMKCQIYGLLFLQLSTSLEWFHPLTFVLKNRIGLDSMDIPDIIFTNLLRIIMRSVSGSATDSPCTVCGCGWTTCSCVVVQLEVNVSKRKLVCRFDIAERNFLLVFSFYYCRYALPRMLPLLFVSHCFNARKHWWFILFCFHRLNAVAPIEPVSICFLFQ